MTDPVPWQLSVPRCGASVPTGAGGSPQPCQRRVEWAGLRLRLRRGKPDEVWRSFACSAHADHLRAARPLLDRDRAVLEDWQTCWADAVAGRGWVSPGPLAVGAEARDLVARAERAATASRDPQR